MKLYGDPLSSSTRKALVTLAEKNAAYQLVRVELAAGEQQSRAHRTRHPFARVPALEHGAFVLYETSAILRYLDDVLPGPMLTPRDPRERARMEQWLSVESAYLEPAIAKLTSELRTGPHYGVPPDAMEVADARSQVSECLAVLDRALAGRKHLVGAQFSLAEIVFVAALSVLLDLRQGDLVRARPNVFRLWVSGSARPSFCDAAAAPGEASARISSAPLAPAVRRPCAAAFCT